MLIKIKCLAVVARQHLVALDVLDARCDALETVYVASIHSVNGSDIPDSLRQVAEVGDHLQFRLFFGFWWVAIFAGHADVISR